jgi:hypothetical protein
MRAAAVTLCLILGGCGIPEHGPMMEPGADCMECHSTGSKRAWTAAGTVFSSADARPDEGLQGVEVSLTDSKNRTIRMTTNGAGNFYTAETLFFPVNVDIKLKDAEMKMADMPPVGSCNSCHTGLSGPTGIGRIHVP